MTSQEMTGPVPADPSDLGRRLTETRQHLGMSIGQVAARAEMDPGYLRYLETVPDATPTRAGLVRLAVALGTSLSDLHGAGRLRPPGGSAPAPEAVLEPLDADACRALLSGGGVGRFVFLEARGPVALPVNFGMLGGDVVFRTAAATSLAARALQQRVSFEIDHIDDALSEGWSVLVSGRAHAVVDPDELEQLRALDVRPWAGGRRQSWFRLVPDEITGRRIRVGVPSSPVGPVSSRGVRAPALP